MRVHSQNLNDTTSPAGSMFWHGRAWLYPKESHNEIFHCEWLFGNRAKGFAATVGFGYGDSDRGVNLHFCIPFLFSVFLIFAGGPRMKSPHRTGIGIHMGAIHFYPFVNSNEWNRKMPWWEKGYHYEFPWVLTHWSTEVMEHKAKNILDVSKPVWCQTTASKKANRKLGVDIFKSMADQESAAKSVSETYEYTYTKKNGEVQNRKADVHVDRMTWRARWWPLIPIQKTRTSIDVKFNDEVGEGSGSWKGGCIGCGYEMRDDETPLMTLRRMEKEREFKR